MSNTDTLIYSLQNVLYLHHCLPWEVYTMEAKRANILLFRKYICLKSERIFREIKNNMLLKMA